MKNCEQRLFQRPDDAIHRGYDKQTEADFAGQENFFSNYEPLASSIARELVEDSIGFYQFTEPMQAMIRGVAANGKSGYFVSSAHPRLVEGNPSKNPRYLQSRLEAAERELGRLKPKDPPSSGRRNGRSGPGK